ncbi:hypothetical protein [Thermomonospora sp. CIF 1]|uniref:hypothetical protein n=1 Tax=Thermomonospora sp. CIF 1 TaxID=1916083 RepID=UPI000CC65811|nr:hypothetical protein [Thermomonospora sp. CIF 1]PKK15637.1 MAG: hypothetical protein BUE48_002995 [Thermomonospora sp. CIF 1]
MTDHAGRPSQIPQPGSKEIEVDPGYLRNFANQMQADLDRLVKGRYRERLQDALPNAGSLGNYQAGRSLYTTIKNGHESIGFTFQQFTTVYQQVIDALRQCARNYENAEQSNVATARNVYRGADSGGGTLI